MRLFSSITRKINRIIEILYRYAGIYFIKFCYQNFSWKILKILPLKFPDTHTQNMWSSSNDPEYQAWLNNNSISGHEPIITQHKEIKSWQNPPSFSIITPIFNTNSKVLTETIQSVLQQSYPFWQFCIVDDGSILQETIDLIESGLVSGPRIDLIRTEKNLGISEATNKALDHAIGDYIIFLDHDDRITPDALYCLASEIKKNPSVDILYSDRDMINPKGQRNMHLMKPDWSPETLLSGNYLFHLMCYRREFIKKLGGYRKAFDGSQDYDLILRAADNRPLVKHIPKVLYSWRQTETSIAYSPESKEYVFDAGKAALCEALSRRGIKAKAFENTNLWRGNYYINFKAPHKKNVLVIDVQPGSSIKSVLQSIQPLASTSYLVFINTLLKPKFRQSIQKLAAPLILEEVGITTGKIINQEQQIFHAGQFFTPEGKIFSPYRGFPETEPGYMAITDILRNISLPHPFCLAIKKSLFDEMLEIKNSGSFEAAILDLSLRARSQDWRVVYEPKAVFQLKINREISFEFGSDQEYSQLRQKLINRFTNGDPYYNSALTNSRNDMSLKND